MPTTEVKVTELVLELGESVTLNLRRMDGSQRRASVLLSDCGEMVVHDQDGLVREEK
jgi:hypothetical protein